MLQVVVPCVCMLYSWFSHILYPWGLTAAPSIRFYCVMPWAHKTETRFCVWGRGLQKRDLCWWQSFLWGYDLKTVYNACSGRNDTLLNGCLALKRYKTPCKERLVVVPGVGWGRFLNLTWPCSQEATRWHMHMCLKFQRSSSQFQRRDMYSLSMYGFKFKTQEIKKIFKILFLSSDIEGIEKKLNKHKANLMW